MRKSGDPYITHPLAVTTILADIGMTEPTLVAALLHDTVEDTPYTLDAAAARTSATRSPSLVDGVTKLDKVQVRRLGAGRDHPQDDRRDVARHPGAGHQARRPAAQHAHAALRQPRRQERTARETLDIYAPLAHRLGMNTIKWELEDLAFATLHPKIYDEIVRTGRRARAVARPVPGRGDQPGRERPARGEDQGHGHRAAQALLLDLPEDDRRRPRVLRHLRPGRHPDPRRGGPRLLLRPRRAALALEPRARAVQGLRRDAEVQHVPVAAHHRDRSAGQAGRAADPHLRAAPSRGVRRRGALEVQGGRPRPASTPSPRRAPSRRRHVLAAAAARLAAGGRGPGRVPRVAALRDEPRRGLRLHAPRRRHRAPRGRHARRLRLRRAHRGRPPHHRRPGQRPARAAGVDARQRRRGRGVHLQGGQRRSVSRLAQLRQVTARALQDPSVVHQGTPRGGDRARQGPDRQADAQGGPAAQAADDPRVADAGGRALQPRRRLGAVRRGRRGQPQRPGRRTPGHRPARRRRRCR